MDDVLLDTNVVSELTKPRPDPHVLEFLNASVDPWLSSITLHELVYGAERAPARRRAELLAWIVQITTQFEGRTIAVDNAVAEHSGRLRALAATRGRPASVIDSLIAASAQMHGLTVATRNTKDFETFGVPLINPWLGLQNPAAD